MKYEDYTRAEVQSALQALFDKQYELELEEEVEIRTRTETRTGTTTYTDPETGETTEEEYEYEVEVEYEYYILNVTLKNNCYTFTSCEEADRRMYENLTNDQVAACRKNVDAFYADRNLQVMWKKVILHPVCLILRKDGSLEPADLKRLNPEILDQFQQHPIRIGDPESYEWIFNQQ